MKNTDSISSLGRSFWLYLGGRFVHSFCYLALLFGVSVWVIHSGENGASRAAFFTASSLVITLVFPPLFAPISDRFCRRKIMLISDVVSVFPVLILMLVAYFDRLTFWILCLVFWFYSCVRSLFDSSSNSILPQLVSVEKMGKAQVSLQASGSVLSVMSGLLGAYIASMVPLWQLFALCVIGIMGSIVSVYFIQVRAIQSDENKARETVGAVKTWLADLIGGWLYVREVKVLWRLMWILAGINFVVGPFTYLVEVYVLRDMGLTAKELGHAVLFSAIGVLISTYIYRRHEMNFRSWRYIVTGLVLLGPVLIVTGMINNYIAVMFACLLKSLLVTLVNVPLHVQITLSIKENFRSRVLNLLGTISGISIPISLMIYGWLLERVDVADVLILVGALILFFAPMLWLNTYMYRFMRISGARISRWCNLVYGT